MGTTTTLLTFEEFERLPDQPGKRELLEGELIELPPAELKHNRIAHRIYHRLIAADLPPAAGSEIAPAGLDGDQSIGSARPWKRRCSDCRASRAERSQRRRGAFVARPLIRFLIRFLFRMLFSVFFSAHPELVEGRNSVRLNVGRAHRRTRSIRATRPKLNVRFVAS